MVETRDVVGHRNGLLPQRPTEESGAQRAERRSKDPRAAAQVIIMQWKRNQDKGAKGGRQHCRAE